MSWFSSFNDLKDKVQSSVTDLAANAQDLASSATNPKLLDNLQKLTLQSPELREERERIENEERRKEQVRDSLAEILPWETRDSEMEILVDECKEVILGLSGKDETFTGPFVLDGGLPSVDSVPSKKVEDGDDDDEDELDAKNSEKDFQAAQLSATKLSKLQPLPALLANFDLDTHVGLIQRLFKVDPKLVEMHSRLSSGGKKEETFWKNYFFHCAYTRYEAGLSIDEIWSNEPRASLPSVPQEEEEFDLVDGDNKSNLSTQSDEEVIFDTASDSASKDSSSIEAKTTSSSSLFAEKSKISPPSISTTPATPAPAVTASQSAENNAASSRSVSVANADSNVDTSVGGTDYELVSDAGGDGDDSMDELEAEIAAALDD